MKKLLTIIMMLFLVSCAGKPDEFRLMGTWGGYVGTNVGAITFDREALFYQFSYRDTYTHSVSGDVLTIARSGGHSSSGRIVNANELILYKDDHTPFTVYRLTPDLNSPGYSDEEYRHYMINHPHAQELSRAIMPGLTDVMEGVKESGLGEEDQSVGSD